MGLSSEMLYLSESAEALCKAAGNIGGRTNVASDHPSARSRRPDRADPCATTATGEIPLALAGVRVGEYARQAEEAREANGPGEVGSANSTDEAW